MTSTIYLQGSFVFLCFLLSGRQEDTLVSGVDSMVLHEESNMNYMREGVVVVDFTPFT